MHYAGMALLAALAFGSSLAARVDLMRIVTRGNCCWECGRFRCSAPNWITWIEYERIYASTGDPDLTSFGITWSF